jgi:uncharacterized protein YjbI with pentapeptide repeats
LVQVRLAGAKLADLKAEDADWSSVNLRDTVLTGASFAGSDLKALQLRGADLSGADLSAVANADRWIWDDATVWPEGFDPASLPSSTGTPAYHIAPEAQLEGADLGLADLAGADLHGANLRGAIFTLTNLNGANLTDADLTDAQWSGTTCPDGTKSDDADDKTCLSHLTPSAEEPSEEPSEG